jgi:DNA ligase D-like protein (predicted polymerase)/DNA ligase D-like protein (predicted 3'-phosphoesterase)
MGDLREYRRRRDPRRTPEPVPAEDPPAGTGTDRFVIQEHHARRLHWDVRLERDGVLVSFAVPKNLPTEAGEIRLAVHTEDHPLEYLTFHGEIPKGEYGAGSMTIWDSGHYETEKWTDDEIAVTLHGERTHGQFVFFTHGERRDWMVRQRSDPRHGDISGSQQPPHPDMSPSRGSGATPTGRVHAPSVIVEGRRLTLSNLDKVLYPMSGFSKGEVIDYYTRIAPVLLPYLADRPVTLRRYPDGVDGQSFFEKNVPRHAPDWVRTVELPTPGSSKGAATTNFAVVGDLPTLVWLANLAVLELHVPQWTVGPRGAQHPPDLLVFDLDPGPPATVVECCRVAERVLAVLEGDGLTGFPKTSGGKGLQIYAPVRVSDPERTATYARAVAEQLAEQAPDLVVSRMAKTIRTGKVFIDWSQNNPAKTTVAPYSLRAREQPTVSTPLDWEEVRCCRQPSDLVYTAPEVLARVERSGDLWAGTREPGPPLPRRQ